MTESGTKDASTISRDEIREKFAELREGVDTVRDKTEGKARKYAIFGGFALVVIVLLILRRRRSSPRALVEVYRV